MRSPLAGPALVSHVPVSHLARLPLEDRYEALPAFLRELIAGARRACAPSEIILFGSRARGDETPLSDWDLCFRIREERRLDWLRFRDDALENARTLLPLDLVAWADASEALRERVAREGIVLCRE